MWTENETSDSLEAHVSALLNSELTLCPGGFNAETYRIYEALSCGSVPVFVIEGNSGNCHSPLRLLKSYGIPGIFLNTWDDLPALLQNELSLSLMEKVERRRRVVAWYRGFLRTMRDRLLSVLS
jgi:hypothetical protein